MIMFPGPPSAAGRALARIPAHASAGAWIVDTHDRDEFAAGHIPDVVNIELNPPVTAALTVIVRLR